MYDMRAGASTDNAIVTVLSVAHEFTQVKLS